MHHTHTLPLGYPAYPTSQFVIRFQFLIFKYFFIIVIFMRHILKFWPVILISISLFGCKDFNSPKKIERPGLTGYWYEQPLRIQQTVLRQPDVIDYDVDSLVAYLKSTHADVLVINGGGIVDYFQNTLPMANINKYLGDRDLLKEVVEACHANEIKVITRVDFRGVEKERYDLHPDWFGNDPNGNPLLLNYTTPELCAPCYNSYYRNEHSVQFISTLFEKYNIDGIWHNAVNDHQTCYCDQCEKKYLEAYNRKIPLGDGHDNDWEEYYRWKADCADEQLTLMRKTVKKYGEDKVYSAEVFSMFDVTQQKHTGIDLFSASKYFDFLVTVSFLASNSANVEYKDISYASDIVKFLKSLQPGKSPVILFGGNGTEHRYIYDPPIDSRLWLWEAVGSGGGFWNCYFNGAYPAVTLDVRNAYVHKDAYEYLKNNAAVTQGLVPVTDIAIFYSKASGQMVGDNEFSLPIKGFLRLLHEEHYQYGFISDHQLTMEKLNQFNVLIMPNVVGLKEQDATLIRNWVNEGGKLIATFATSLFDENGERREDFLLADLFGCHFTGNAANTEVDCYQQIVKRTSILDGFDKTTLIHNGGNTMLCAINPEAFMITGYLPKINNQPPEFAFPDSWETEYPVIVENSFGKGKVIYFANQPGKLNYTVGHPDYHNLLNNAIITLQGNEETLRTDAPSSVHIYLNKSNKDPELYQLSLINTTSGAMRPMRDLVPIHNITIELPFVINSAEVISKFDSKIDINKMKLHIETLNDFCSLILTSK